MTDLPMPLLSAPGRQVQTSGGRLINTYVEKLAPTAGKSYCYPRVPGLKGFGTTDGTGFRGGLEVGSLVYFVVDNTCYQIASTGGAATALTGTVPGTAAVVIARDNAATPHVVIVSPGDGAVLISGSAIVDYPDSDVGQPNSVSYLKGVFVFTYGDGKTRNSDVNSTSINTLSVATAESKPDTLYRGVPLGNGQLLLVGSSSMEVWGGENDTGYFFSYIATINRGIVGPYAIAGHEDGFGKGIFFVGDDFKVYTLNGYTPQAVSTTDVDLAIERETDKTLIRVGCFIANGHGFVTVQAPTWCWCFETDTQTWHERKSHLEEYWRGMFPFKAFDKWLCGDSKSGNLLQIDGQAQDELGDALRLRIETGPIGAFPQAIFIAELNLYLTKGVGVATGLDPVQTDPVVEVSISRDGGQTFSNPRVIKVGRQSITAGRIRASLWGQADVQGVIFRFDFSSNVSFSFMGADITTKVLR
jgi:hypothetical protein